MVVVLIGWLGTLLYLVNHAYISFNINWRKLVYYSGNAIAAACLIVSSFVVESWQAVAVNSFWVSASVALLLNVDLSKIPFSPRVFYVILGLMSLWLIGDGLFNSGISLAVLGWISAFVFSGCYLLFCAEKMRPRRYLCWNAFAAIALLPQMWVDQNWPVFALEIVWAIISIYGAAKRSEDVHLL